MWTLELEAMHRLGAAFVLCCHPFLSGRPSRAEALERLIERMKCLARALDHHRRRGGQAHGVAEPAAPRTCPQPVLPADAYWVARPPD